MKGLYMVDADRGFVQYFENLLFTHSNEYKMLGHNFKANEFLLKVKERPDLLDKIDLLFINPKLNDLNGLELYKKIQAQRKDIEVCILVNENIKTFYENDIAELGIENVILYPNSDEYYLESVKNIFEKIDNKQRFNLVGQNNENTKKDILSDKDLFSELNSDDFLSQFDFDSLSTDMFSDKSKEDKTYEPKKEEYKAEEPVHNMGSDVAGNNGFVSPSPREEVQFGYNTKPVSNAFENQSPSFVTPNFAFDDEESTDNDFIFGDTGYNNSYENNSYGPNSYDNQPFDGGLNKGFEEKYDFNEPYDNGNAFPASTPYAPPVGGMGAANPLDLGAFGVGFDTSEPKDNFHIFETPKFIKKPQEDDIFGSPYGDSKPDIFGGGYNNPGSVDTYSPAVPDFLNQPVGLDTNDFVAPYDNGNINQKSNLQNINRPDIDGIDDFKNYGEQQNFANGRGPAGFNNPVDNGINGGYEPVKPNPVPDRHAGFNNPVSAQPSGFGYNNPSPVGGPSGYNEPINKVNPYDEYLNLGKKEEVKPQVPNSYPNPSDFSVKEEKPFGGFDFSKPSVNGAAPVPGGFNKPNGNSFMNDAPQGAVPNSNFNDLAAPMDPFGGESFDNTATKSYIKNMYNKAGVEDLNYAPTTGSNNDFNRNPIRHEKTADSSYKQVPDFARQIVAFYSTKGGIGKTSLAVNATIQLAKYSKKKICLIDFDLTNANVHTHLGILDSTYDLSVVSNFESEIDSFSLSRIVTPYRVKDKNGDTVEFDVIVGFKEMKMAQRFSEKEVYKILSILEEMYDIVVVDTHPVYTDLAVSTILKKATKIVFVTEQEMTALNGAKDFILASKKYNIPPEKLFMVLNRYKPQTSIFNKNRIEKGLNKTVLATIPFDMDSLRDAVNTNNPVTISNPDSELARAYIDVAKIVDTKLVIPEENKGFFKLFKK